MTSILSAFRDDINAKINEIEQTNTKNTLTMIQTTVIVQKANR